MTYRLRFPARSLLVALFPAAALIAACGGTPTATPDNTELTGENTEPTADNTEQDSAGVRVVSATSGAEIKANPPENLVILDVRTAEEFDQGHLDGAILIDFYRDDFAKQIAELDPDVPYLLYCRSGNRSGQTAAIMQDLGFSDVADIDGGIVSWSGAGLPIANG